jgi:hypothetical protein
MNLTKKWVLAGIVCGILADIVYPVSIFVSLPLRVAYPVFWSFGPLLVVAAIGLYYFLREYRQTVSLQLGVLFMIIAGATVTLMGTMQGALRIVYQEIKQDITGESTNEALRNALSIGNSIQLGADLAWDVFILSSIILLGIAMMNHPKFGKVFGLAGIIIGLMGLAFNIYTFPVNPGTAGLIDVGPLVGLWFLAIVIQMIRHFKSVGESNSTSQLSS